MAAKKARRPQADRSNSGTVAARPGRGPIRQGCGRQAGGGGLAGRVGGCGQVGGGRGEPATAGQWRNLLPPGASEGGVTCSVSTASEDARHAVYDALRRTAAAGAAGPGEAGQPGPPPAHQ